MLKTIKIPTFAPTCFGSRRSHNQGAILRLAKTTVIILLCSSLMTWSMLCRHDIGYVINDDHYRIITVVLSNHKIGP